MESLTTTSVKLDYVLEEIKGLSEMEMLQLLEQLKFYIEEKSHFPHLLNKLVDDSEIDEANIIIENLKDEIRVKEKELDNAIDNFVDLKNKLRALANL